MEAEEEEEVEEEEEEEETEEKIGKEEIVKDTVPCFLIFWDLNDNRRKIV